MAATYGTGSPSTGFLEERKLGYHCQDTIWFTPYIERERERAREREREIEREHDYGNLR